MHDIKNKSNWTNKYDNQTPLIFNKIENIINNNGVNIKGSITITILANLISFTAYRYEEITLMTETNKNPIE